MENIRNKESAEPSPRALTLSGNPVLTGLIDFVREAIESLTKEKLYKLSEAEFNSVKEYRQIYLDLLVNHSIFRSKNARYYLLEQLHIKYDDSFKRIFSKRKFIIHGKIPTMQELENFLKNSEVI